MNQPDQGEQLADFIPLQGADHVPAHFLRHIAFLSGSPGPQLVQSGEIFLDLSGALPIDMVLLLDLGTIVSVDSGILPPSGIVKVDIGPLPPLQPFWGMGWPIQVITANGTLSQFRLGQVRRFVIFP